MSKWLHEIRLNDWIYATNEAFDLTRLEEPCPPVVAEILASEIEKASPIAWLGQKLRESKSLAENNRILSRVFDEADRCRVWCGGFERVTEDELRQRIAEFEPSAAP